MVGVRQGWAKDPVLRDTKATGRVFSPGTTRTICETLGTLFHFSKLLWDPSTNTVGALTSGLAWSRSGPGAEGRALNSTSKVPVLVALAFCFLLRQRACPAHPSGLLIGI